MKFARKTKCSRLLGWGQGSRGGGGARPHLPSLLLGGAGLCGAAALEHHVVQLLSLKDDGEEVDLPLWLGLSLLHE